MTGASAIPAPEGIDRQFQPRYVATLDGLRGFAVLLVLWAHIPVAAQPALLGSLRRAVQPGYLGVDVFFVLSGFLITRILLRDRAEGRSLRRFWLRRAIRIFPIYYLLIAFLLLIWPGEYLLAAFFYVQNFTFIFDGSPNPLRHTWSLAVEEHYYMVWPLIVLLARPDWTRLAAWAILAVGLLLGVSLALSDWEFAAGFNYRATPIRCASLAAGSILAFVELFAGGNQGRFLRLAVGLALLSVLAGGGLLASGIDFSAVKLVTSAGLSTAIVAGCIWLDRLDGAVIRRLLTGGVLVGVGRISYGIYLYHYPVYVALGLQGNGSDTPSGLVITSAVAASVAIAATSWFLIERPLLKWKDRF